MDFIPKASQDFAQFSQHYPWAGYLVEVILLILAAWFLRRVVIGYLTRCAKRTQTTFDDQIVALLSSAMRPFLLLAVLALTLNSVPLPAHILAMSNRLLTLATTALALYYTYRAVLVGWREAVPTKRCSIPLASLSA
jgi:hypothetical protein